METRGAVARHYAGGDDLEQRIVEQLRGAGLLEGAVRIASRPGCAGSIPRGRA